MTSLLKPTLARANSVVMLRPDAPLLTAEIQRLAGEENYQATKNALASLLKRGIISAVRRGEKEAFVPNRSNPMYLPLLQSAILDLPWAASLKAKGVDLAEVTAIYAYGSVLQGSFGPGSDLDVVVAAPKRIESQLASSFDPIERMIGRPVDVAVMSSSEIVDRKTRGDAYIEKVLSGLRVYGEDLRCVTTTRSSTSPVPSACFEGRSSQSVGLMSTQRRLRASSPRSVTPSTGRLGSS